MPLREMPPNLFVGSGASRNIDAWNRVHRALDHGPARNSCIQVSNSAAMPSTIRLFAATFVKLQGERHRAAYDPSTMYYRSEVKPLINDAEGAIARLKSTPRHERRTFAAVVMLRKR